MGENRYKTFVTKSLSNLSRTDCLSITNLVDMYIKDYEDEAWFGALPRIIDACNKIGFLFTVPLKHGGKATFVRRMK